MRRTTRGGLAALSATIATALASVPAQPVFASESPRPAASQPRSPVQRPRRVHPPLWLAAPPVFAIPAPPLPVRHHLTTPFPTGRKPWYLRIPRIGVYAKVTALGYPRGAYLPVPPLSAAFRVGWYRFTSAPGQRGNAVLVGHVDTYRGPAVFYNLYLLRPGDPIYIHLASHRDARYLVRTIKEVPKDEFPATAIFGDTATTELWLITCGGPFDYQTHHYLDNIIVSAVQPGRSSHARAHSHHNGVMMTGSAYPGKIGAATRGAFAYMPGLPWEAARRGSDSFTGLSTGHEPRASKILGRGDK